MSSAAKTQLETAGIRRTTDLPYLGLGADPTGQQRETRLEYRFQSFRTALFDQQSGQYRNGRSVSWTFGEIFQLRWVRADVIHLDFFPDRSGPRCRW